MRYHGYRAAVGESRRLLHRLGTIRKTLRDERRAKRAYRPGCGHLKPIRPALTLGSTDIALIASVRNEEAILPAFLAHYRELGVTRFVFVDDRSEDGTVGLLASEADVDLYISDIRYGEAHFGGLWYYDLAHQYGLNRWYLQVDADEFLVYDGMERRKLPELIRWLEQRQLKRMLAPAIDLYPAVMIREAALEPGRMPWEVADHLDSTGYTMSLRPYGPVIEGGGMNRVFGDSLRQKYPLVFWDKRTSYHRTIHFPLPYNYLNYNVLGVALHFKCFSYFASRTEAALLDGQHAGGTIAYQRYRAALDSDANLTMAGPNSIPYEGPQQLVELGFMEPISYDEG